jgi:CheY-like chemotaxis protein/HPt (histidine-containing phosphotransfer) domain-containing protein
LGIEGSGLGLSISRSIVSAMGGDISVTSEYGAGSTFSVTIPQKYHKRDALAVVSRPEDKSVLFFERRQIYADSIVYTIDNLGANCTLVTSESELFDKLKLQGYDFLFVSFFLYERSKEVISRYGGSTQIIVLTEYGEAIPETDLNVLTMPAHSVAVANVLNDMTDKTALGEGGAYTANFTAPGARVLIVDDININLRVAQGLLAPYKLQIDLCGGGAEALEAIKINTYDAVFMDYIMPEMDGVETVRRIRSLGGEDDAYYKTVPVIALTADAIYGNKEMFLQNGFNDYLLKPINFHALHTILEKWIPRHKQIMPAYKNDSPTAPPAAHKGLKINGVDTEAGIKRFAGKTDWYLRELRAFARGLETDAAPMETALSPENVKTTLEKLHTLKGVAGNMAATALYDALAAFEASQRNGNPDRGLYEAIWRRLEETRESILKS